MTTDGANGVVDDDDELGTVRLGERDAAVRADDGAMTVKSVTARSVVSFSRVFVNPWRDDRS